MVAELPADAPGMVATWRRAPLQRRPGLLWAAAFFGLAFTVGGVALRFAPNNSAITEASAAFVDPVRAMRTAADEPASAERNSPQEQREPAPTPPVVANPVTPVTPPVLTVPQVAPPVVAPPAPPMAPVAAVSNEPAAASLTEPKDGPATGTHGKSDDDSAPAAKPAAHHASPPPRVARPTPTPKPRPVAEPQPIAVEREEPKPAKAAPVKVAKPSKKANSEVDEETRKALEALQKSQLESSF